MTARAHLSLAFASLALVVALNERRHRLARERERRQLLHSIRVHVEELTDVDDALARDRAALADAEPAVVAIPSGWGVRSDGTWTFAPEPVR